MALQFTQAAIQGGAEPQDVAKAALKDAISGANAAEAENLGVELYKEATGRFPQNSVDRKAVYLGGFILVGLVFVVLALMTFGVVTDEKEVPESIVTLATALVSGVIGGLFGYAKQ